MSTNLTPRVMRTLQLTADGYSGRQTGKMLDPPVKETTIQTYLQIAREVLDARSTAHAVAIGIRKGYIQ